MSSENYRIGNQHSVYFLTFTVTDWVDVFTRLNYKNIIVDSLEYCIRNKGLKLFAWCLMTNHIHIVCTTEIPFMMSDFVRDFKKFTANAVIKDIQNMPESRRDWMLYRFELAGKYDNRITKYRFWQDKNHPIELTSTEMINQRINYTHEIPVRTGVVAVAEDYLYSSTRNYAGLSSFIEIEIAKVLSKNITQVRVDFYDVKGKPYFGEMTFTTGFGYFSKRYYNYLGSKIDLSKVKK